MPRWIVACNLCFTPVNRKWYYFQFKCVLQLGSEYLHHQIPSTQISLSFCRCQWHWRRGQGRRSVQSSICCGISLLGVVPLTVVAFGGLSYSDTSMIQGRATSTLVHLFCESAVYGLFFRWKNEPLFSIVPPGGCRDVPCVIEGRATMPPPATSPGQPPFLFLFFFLFILLLFLLCDIPVWWSCGWCGVSQ